jgi:ankyrin repeat protein
MSLSVYAKYVRNIFLSVIFLVCPMISMDQSLPAVIEKQGLNFSVEYLDDILSDSIDSLGNVVTFEDRYGMFVHEFSQLGLGNFRTFFTEKIKKKAGSRGQNIIMTPELIDYAVSATEKNIIQAYSDNKEYQKHIQQVILDAIQARKNIDEVQDPLFMHLIGISFLQPVMTQYINDYNEMPYDVDSCDEEDSDYEDYSSCNDTVEEKDPLFFEALTYNNNSFIDFFIDYNADLDSLGESKNTLLHHAAKWNNAKIVAFLFTRAEGKKQAESMNSDYQYPVHVAAIYNTDEVMLELFKNGVDIDLFCGSTPLMYAIRKNSDKVSKLLIDYGAQLEHYFLNDAAEYNAYKVIPYLLAAKFQESPGKVVIRALSKAAEKDADQAAQVLLDSFSAEYVPAFLQVSTEAENKFRFEVADESMSFLRKDILYADPLFCAVLYNSEKVIQLFLRHEKINQSNFLQRSNVLEVAVSHDADKIVKLLIAAGMDIHVLGYQNLNLLQRAANSTAHKSIPLLLEAGLNVDNQMLLSCLQPYLFKLSNKEQSCAISLIQATNNACKKRKIDSSSSSSSSRAKLL